MLYVCQGTARVYVRDLYRGSPLTGSISPGIWQGHHLQVEELVLLIAKPHEIAMIFNCGSTNGWLAVILHGSKQKISWPISLSPRKIKWTLNLSSLLSLFLFPSPPFSFLFFCPLILNLALTPVRGTDVQTFGKMALTTGWAQLNLSAGAAVRTSCGIISEPQSPGPQHSAAGSSHKTCHQPSLSWAFAFRNCIVWFCSWGDVNKCLLTPVRELRTEQTRDATRVESVSQWVSLGLLEGKWAKVTYGNDSRSALL